MAHVAMVSRGKHWLIWFAVKNLRNWDCRSQFDLHFPLANPTDLVGRRYQSSNRFPLTEQRITNRLNTLLFAFLRPA
jgi:hypothetical protein